jgi:hypothetical protein
MNLNRAETERLEDALARYLRIDASKLDYSILHKVSSDNVVAVKLYHPSSGRRLAVYVTVRGVTRTDPRPRRKQRM